jgi:nickel-dependent lactate racemase
VIETLSERRVIRVPWASWRGDIQRELDFPPEWDVVPLPPADAPALDAAQIARALDEPVGAPRVEDLVRGKTSVAVAIDDLSRPVPASLVLEPLVSRLEAAGIRAEHITIVVASGAHRRATRDDLEQKIGQGLLRRVRAVEHDPTASLVDTGVSLAGVPVRINAAFWHADVRVGVCGVLPHPFAGFSGGGKIVIPGLADLDVLARTHRYALMGFSGGPGQGKNRFRTDMERAVGEIGLHWTVNVVTNSRREIAMVAAGDFVQAHRAAAAGAARVGSTAAPHGLLDAMVLNAYPKDTELLQIEASLAALRCGMDAWLAPAAPIVLAGACSDGLGSHGLFEPGGRLFRVPSQKTFLAGRPLIVFCPTVDPDVAASIFWSGYPVCPTWEGVIGHLRQYLAPGARVGIVPCAPLQIAGEAARS